MQIPRWVHLLASAGFPLMMAAANWPTWRGPNGDGATPEKGFVTSWDRTNHVVWRVPLPEPGNSSPIVWENRVFVTQAEGQRRTLICVDRKTGKIIWQTGPRYELPEETMKESNPYCAASPVTDGERVIAFFGSAGLHCFDWAGREVWKADLGAISHPFGSASSPCVWGDYCFVYVGPGEQQSLVAVDKRSGKLLWRSDALKPDASEAAQISPQGPPVGSWSTPVIVETEGRPQLVMSFAFRFGGYALESGKLLWQQSGLGLQTYVTPVVTDGMIIAMSGTASIAVRPPAKNEHEPRTVWTQPKGKFRFGSGVATEDHLYFLSENGLAECWEKRTGKVLWQERLAGPGKKGTSWSSLSRAGNQIYAPNQSGDVFVIAAEPKFRVLSTNSISEPTNASVALAGGTVIMRTGQALWCFGREG